MNGIFIIIFGVNSLSFLGKNEKFTSEDDWLIVTLVLGTDLIVDITLYLSDRSCGEDTKIMVIYYMHAIEIVIVCRKKRRLAVNKLPR